MDGKENLDQMNNKTPLESRKIRFQNHITMSEFDPKKKQTSQDVGVDGLAPRFCLLVGGMTLNQALVCNARTLHVMLRENLISEEHEGGKPTRVLSNLLKSLTKKYFPGKLWDVLK